MTTTSGYHPAAWFALHRLALTPGFDSSVGAWVRPPMPTIETCCTQCGTENTTTAATADLDHGTGREHGTETLPCDTCGTITVQNRCGGSVPTADN